MSPRRNASGDPWTAVQLFDASSAAVGSSPVQEEDPRLDHADGKVASYLSRSPSLSLPLAAALRADQRHPADRLLADDQHALGPSLVSDGDQDFAPGILEDGSVDRAWDELFGEVDLVGIEDAVAEVVGGKAGEGGRGVGRSGEEGEGGDVLVREADAVAPREVELDGGFGSGGFARAAALGWGSEGDYAEEAVVGVYGDAAQEGVDGDCLELGESAVLLEDRDGRGRDDVGRGGGVGEGEEVEAGRENEDRSGWVRLQPRKEDDELSARVRLPHSRARTGSLTEEMAAMVDQSGISRATVRVSVSSSKSDTSIRVNLLGAIDSGQQLWWRRTSGGGEGGAHLKTSAGWSGERKSHESAPS